MSEISRFYGIIIRMFDPDHPPPHFHAIYAEHEALITIQPIAVHQGFAACTSAVIGLGMGCGASGGIACELERTSSGSSTG